MVYYSVYGVRLAPRATHARGCRRQSKCLWCPTVSARGVYGVLQCLWCPTVSQWRSVVPVVSMVS